MLAGRRVGARDRGVCLVSDTICPDHGPECPPITLRARMERAYWESVIRPILQFLAGEEAQ